MPTPPLPPQVTITPLAAHHIPPLKRINSLLLPIRYPDSFYANLLTPTSPTISPATLNFVAEWTAPAAAPKVIGGVLARLQYPLPADPPELYILTLALLAPYRHLGIATALLAALLAASVPAYVPASVSAHVWERNEDALEWYRARGFEVGDVVEGGYYKRLRPGGARVVRRPLERGVTGVLGFVAAGPPAG